MPNERLLERLRFIEQDPDYRGATDPHRLIISVQRHLQRILNTSQGSALIDENYGVPEFTDLVANFSNESVRELARTIKHVIQTYEPRLSTVQIEVSPKSETVFELHFKINGRMHMDNNMEMPISFETIVDPEGRIRVTT